MIDQQTTQDNSEVMESDGKADAAVVCVCVVTVFVAMIHFVT